jgi:soluble lytic murein transglycosylase-like protein
MKRSIVKKMKTWLIIVSIIITCFLLSSCGSKAGEDDPEHLRLASMNDGEVAGYLSDLGARDIVTPFLRDENAKKEADKFFVSLARSEKVATAILENAEKNGIRPSLAFALALEESGFKTNAVNDNGDSIDRGLFQLNSKSFPSLGEKEVFDPEVNARYGLAHLKYCLLEGGNEVAALAMYNAGNGRVGRGATPRRTLDYVYRVLAYEGNIVDLFKAKVAARAKRPLPVLAMGEGEKQITND